MKVLTPGHFYELAPFESGKLAAPNHLQFIHKEQNPETGELETHVNGTTNEEVLAVLIDRMKFLNDKFPCRENSIVITKLEEALMWLEKRTKDRVSRNVEGKNEA